MWSKLAAELVGYPGVWGHDLYNEPENYGDKYFVFAADNTYTPVEGDEQLRLIVPQLFDAATTAIRAKDTSVVIVRGGNHYSGTWDSGFNRPNGFVHNDAYNRTLYAGHVYPDRDSSGTRFDYDAESSAFGQAPPAVSTNPTIFETRIKPFVDELKSHNCQPVDGIFGIIGEMGIPNSDERWLTVGSNGIDYCRQNGLLNFLWSAGPAWSAYPQSLEPETMADGSLLQALAMAMITKKTGAPEPTLVRFSSPPRATPGQPSAPCVLEYRGNLVAPKAVTLSDNGAGGSFPANVVLPAGRNPRVLFSYTPGTQPIVAKLTASIPGMTIVNDGAEPVRFTGAISGNTLTATNVGGKLAIGQLLNGPGIAPGTYITGASGVPRGAGTYQVNIAQQIAATELTAIGAMAAGDGLGSIICSTVDDGFASLSAPVSSILSENMILNSTYGGPAVTLRRNYDGAVRDWGRTSPTDPRLNRAAIAEWAGSDTALIYRVKTWDQSGNSNHDMPNTVSDQPVWTLDDGQGYPVEVRNPGRKSYLPTNLNNLSGHTLLLDMQYISGDYLFPSTSSAYGTIGVLQGKYGMHVGVLDATVKGPTFTVSAGLLTDAYYTYAYRFRADTISGLQAFRNNVLVEQTDTFGGLTTWDRAQFDEGYFRFADNSNNRGKAKYRNRLIFTGALTDAEIASLTARLNSYYASPWPAIPATIYPPVVTTQNNKDGWNGIVGLPFALLREAPNASATAPKVAPGAATAIGVATAGGSDVLTATITMSAANGVLSGGGGTATGLVYSIPAGNAAAMQAALRAVRFTPNAAADTTFTLEVKNTAGASSVMTVKTAATEKAPLEQSLAATGTFTPRNYFGVNISGGETGMADTRDTHGTSYTYGSLSEFDYWSSKGFGTIRLPFQLQRVQPRAFGPIRANQIGYIKERLDRALANGQYVVLDMHNYGGCWDYFGTGLDYYLVAEVDEGATDRIVDCWKRLVALFKNYPNVIWNLMNEPKGDRGQTALQWKTAQERILHEAVRSQGANQLVMLSAGPDHSGAKDWANKQGAIWDTFNQPGWTGANGDPADNWVFDMHQYLDPGNSGTSATAQAGKGASVLVGATGWCRTTVGGAPRAKPFKAWLGEFGWSPNDSLSSQGVPSQEGTNLVQYMKANRDVWIGFTYWLGGAAGFYKASVYAAIPDTTYNPSPTGDAPQVAILLNGI
ncbi:cellulase family glycosylhydrolase [Sphingomonas aerolata]|uniref:cellulase family glycosylhydrolase n=1 Tax=Sphingomonas aerolata TaxID=185951 RepID=UPI003361B4FC